MAKSGSMVSSRSAGMRQAYCLASVELIGHMKLPASVLGLKRYAHVLFAGMRGNLNFVARKGSLLPLFSQGPKQWALILRLSEQFLHDL